MIKEPVWTETYHEKVISFIFLNILAKNAKIAKSARDKLIFIQLKTVLEIFVFQFRPQFV